MMLDRLLVYFDALNRLGDAQVAMRREAAALIRECR
jgi:hypothetical protein